MSQRASSTLALPPRSYDKPKGPFWHGVGALDRYTPTYPSQDSVFEEYLSNSSMSPSRHLSTLAKSSGLLELHYDTMRKRQQDRAAGPTFRGGPSMDRQFTATAGYSGHIPGKDSNNVCGCTFAQGSRLAHETRGQFFNPPMSGVTFTLGFRSPLRSRSLPQLQRSMSAGSVFGNCASESLSPKAQRGPVSPMSPMRARDLPPLRLLSEGEPRLEG